MRSSRFHLFVFFTGAASFFLLLVFYQHANIRTSSFTYGSRGPEAHDNEPQDRPETPAETSTSSPPTTIHPETVLVLATLSNTDNSWIDHELGDLLGDQTNLYTAIYVTNDTTAPLHTPANKGNEATAYLTYFIDYYPDLPDISILMHGQPTAWHNNHLLEQSTSQAVRHLNREKVLRDGYFNLRAHWFPGCPEHLHPGSTEVIEQKQQEVVMEGAWRELFPETAVPSGLAQPCCSQFAVSRDTIRRRPVEDYVRFRDWLLASDLSDFLLGRVFEYLWQYIFIGETVHCPDARLTYCDGFGVCFEDPEEYLRYFRTVEEQTRCREELQAWEDWENPPEKRDLEGVPGDIVHQKKPVPGGPDPVVDGAEVRQLWLQTRIDELAAYLTEAKANALRAGDDPRRREKALTAIRNASLPAADEVDNGPEFWP